MVREIYHKTLVILPHEAFMWLTMFMLTALVFMFICSRQWSGTTRNVAPKSVVEESIVFPNIPVTEVPLRLHFQIGIVGDYEVDIRLK